MENYNPYQAPNSNLDYDDDYDIPPLYNPNAAALWSILFTPFGAWIHAKNWEAVGEDDLAKQNRLWAIGIIALILVATFIEMFFGFSLPSAPFTIVPLIIWYTQLAKKQITLIKEELGDDYEKKSLVVPVLVGVFGGMIALVVTIYIMYVILSAFGAVHPNW